MEDKAAELAEASAEAEAFAADLAEDTDRHGADSFSCRSEAADVLALSLLQPFACFLHFF